MGNTNYSKRLDLLMSFICSDQAEAEPFTLKEIPNYDGKYYLSSNGYVFSVAQGQKRILRNNIQGKYNYITLYHQNKKENVRLSRLVATLFCDGYSELKEVHHKDGNSLNDKADNLEWLTPEDHQKKHRKLREQKKESDGKPIADE